ncbi:hypothetical protein V3C99_018529, partial [Haemonchus contortus]
VLRKGERKFSLFATLSTTPTGTNRSTTLPILSWTFPVETQRKRSQDMDNTFHMFEHSSSL